MRCVKAGRNFIQELLFTRFIYETTKLLPSVTDAEVYSLKNEFFFYILHPFEIFNDNLYRQRKVLGKNSMGFNIFNDKYLTACPYGTCQCSGEVAIP